VDFLEEPDDHRYTWSFPLPMTAGEVNVTIEIYTVTRG
jgi:hypothetical protein